DASAHFLSLSQSQFRKLCKHVERLLALSALTQHDRSRHQSQAVRLAQLRSADQQLAISRQPANLQRKNDSPMPSQPSKTKSIDQPFRRGTGTLSFWLVPSEQSSPRLRLDRVQEYGTKRKVALSCVLFSLFAFAWGAKYLPRKFGKLRDTSNRPSDV